MRILFITATRIGDAVLSTGLLDHLLRAHPQARFTIACGPAAAGVFARMPRLERLIEVEKRRLDAHWLLLWAQVSTTLWDLVVDLRGSALAFTIPARRRAVVAGGRRPGHRLSHLAEVLDLSVAPLPVTWTAPDDQAFAAMMIPLGGFAPKPPPGSGDPKPHFLDSKTPAGAADSKKWGLGFSDPSGVQGQSPWPCLHPVAQVVGLGPTANWAGKIWPPDRFVAVYRALAAQHPGLRPAIFAGPGAAEAAMAAPVLAALPEAIDLAGRLTLPQAAACLARCALFIGNDSGLMHLAAAAGAPTLGLFGPTSADDYAPSGRCGAVAVADGPAGATPLDRLSVQTVLAAAQSLLRCAAHDTAA